MSWMLPFLFMRLFATVRGANEFVGSMPETTGMLVVVSLLLLLMSVMAGRLLGLSLWPRFQRRAVQ
jgi:hypothetical protein